jgi:hypothetical protein
MRLIPLLALLCACAPAPDGARRAQRALYDGPVTLIDSGHWETVMACSGQCVVRYSFWVDLAVRNDAFDKHVGILIWSDLSSSA